MYTKHMTSYGTIDLEQNKRERAKNISELLVERKNP
jgi:hypothetical protein